MTARMFGFWPGQMGIVAIFPALSARLWKDLNDPESLKAAADGCDALYHVAADYRIWAPDPSELYRTNDQGTVALFRAAAEAGVARMIYTSSVATLGIHSDGTPSNEDTPVSEAIWLGITSGRNSMQKNR